MTRSDSLITSKIRRFKPAGLQQFREWLERAEQAEQPRHTPEPPPTHLLFDPLFTEEVGYGIDLVQRLHDRKYDMGMEVCRVAGDDISTLMADASAWAWLSLFFHESTIEKRKSGKWFTGARNRHLVEQIAGRRYDQSHRHLVKGAATNVSRFGEHATVLMGPSWGMSKIEEQIMSRKVDPPLAFLPEIVKALHNIYWDVEADDIKAGASGDGGGSIMHIEDLIGQFDLTYDISHLVSDKLISMLPSAFDKFRGDNTRRSSRRRRSESSRSDGIGANA